MTANSTEPQEVELDIPRMSDGASPAASMLHFKNIGENKGCASRQECQCSNLQKRRFPAS